jgi:hypothetical protein
VKTEDLIKMLSTNVPPTRRQRSGAALLIASGVGIAIALCFECSMFGTTLEGFEGSHPGLQAAVFALTLTLVAAGLQLLSVSASPGKRGTGALLLIGIVFLAVFLGGIVALMREPHLSWRGMLSGEPLSDCMICVPVIAVPTLAALFWALRNGAPVYPALSGAAAGLVAGATAVAALALHQPTVSVLATAVLYGSAIVLCALIGALIGSRLLRW